MDKEALKCSVVFTVGIIPAPIVKFERMALKKISNGVFTPALVASVYSGSGYKEADFPVTAIEVSDEKAFKDLRDLLHARLDAAFDMYANKWEEKKTKKLEPVSNEG